MTKLQDAPSTAATISAWVALGALAVLVFALAATLFPVSTSLAQQNPEFANLRVPLLALALAVCVCIEVVLLTTALLVGSIRRDGIFGGTAARLVNTLVAAVLVATILTAATMPLLPGPPALVILFLGAVLAGITLTLVLTVLRALLRRTALMRLELDEVV